MFFDRKLSWAKHIEELKTKSLKSLNVLKMTAHTKWGGDRKCLKNLYTALTLSKMDYGSIIYQNAKPNLLRKLDTVQNSALRLISGAMYTSPIPSLHAETNIIPLKHRRSLLSLKYYIKLSSCTANPTRQKTISPNHIQLYHTKNNIPKPVGIHCRNILTQTPLQTSYSHTPKTSPPWNTYITQFNSNFNRSRKNNKQLTQQLKELFLSVWQNEWQQNHLQAKLFKIKPNLGEWHSAYRPNRHEETVLARLRIGHCALTHKHLLEKTPTPRCDSCDEVISVEHILIHCPNYHHERILHFRGLTLAEVLGDEAEKIPAVFQYLRDIGLFHCI